MKTLLSLILIIFSLKAFSQTHPQGSFSTPTGFTGFTIDFKDSNFKYNYWTCTGGKIGEGNWVITNDSLYLNFNKNNKDLKNKILVIDSAFNSKDSLKVEIQFLDEFELPIAYVNIIIGTTINPDTLNQLGFVQTDLDGKAILKIPNNNEILWITAKTVGTSLIYTSITPQMDLKLKGEIYMGAIDKIQNKTIGFKIISISKDEISLQESFPDGFERKLLLRKNK